MVKYCCLINVIFNIFIVYMLLSITLIDFLMKYTTINYRQPRLGLAFK